MQNIDNRDEVDVLQNIGEWLRIARKRMGLTQAELSDLAGVSRQSLQAVEAGRGMCETIGRIAPHLKFRVRGLGTGDTIGKQLYNARRRRGWTQAECATRAGLSIPTVRSLERDRGSGASLAPLIFALAPDADLAPLFRASYQVREDVRLTPPDFIDEIVAYFGPISIDVAGAPDSFITANRVIDEDKDGLRTRWSGRLAWCNPPYSQLSRWMHRCADAWKRKEVEQIIGLFPARTETVAFRTRIVGTADVLLLPRRLRFHDANRIRLAPSPFALMLCTWGFERQIVEAYVTATGSTPIWSTR